MILYAFRFSALTRFSLMAVLTGCMLLSSCYYIRRTPILTDIRSVDRDRIEARHNLSYYAELYPGYDAVYDQVEESIEDRIGDDLPTGYTRWKHTRMMVMDTSYSHSTGSYQFDLSPTAQLTEFLLLVKNPGGRVLAFDQSSVSRQPRLDGWFQYSCKYPPLSRGTLIECYLSVWVSTRLRSESMFISQDFPCDSVRLQFATNRKSEVLWKRTLDADEFHTQGRTSSDPGMKVYELTRSAVPAVSREEYSADRRNKAQYVEFAFAPTATEKPLPSVGTVYQNYRRSVQDASRANDTLRRMSAMLTKNCSSSIESTDSIVRWVQLNLKSVPDRGEVDSESLAAVAQARYGTFASVTSLTKTLLDIAGITSEYYLMRSRGFGPCDPRMLNRSEFQTPALAVRLRDDKLTLLFPAFRAVSRDAFPEWLEHSAIRIQPESDTPRVVALEFTNTTSDTRRIHYAIALRSDSSAEIRYTINCSGVYAQRLHSRVYDALTFTDDVFRDILLQELALPWMLRPDDVSGARIEYTDVNSLTADFGVHVTMTVPNFFALADGHLGNELMQSLLNVNFLSSKRIHEGQRHEPILIPFDSDYDVRIEVTVPAGWRHSVLSDTLRSSSILGSTSLTRHAHENGFLVHRHEILRAGEYSRSFGPALFEQCGARSAINVFPQPLERRR